MRLVVLVMCLASCRSNEQPDDEVRDMLRDRPAELELDRKMQTCVAGLPDEYRGQLSWTINPDGTTTGIHVRVTDTCTRGGYRCTPGATVPDAVLACLAEAVRTTRYPARGHAISYGTQPILDGVVHGHRGN